jgi:hypothetical protein
MFKILGLHRPSLRAMGLIPRSMGALKERTTMSILIDSETLEAIVMVEDVVPR